MFRTVLVSVVSVALASAGRASAENERRGVKELTLRLVALPASLVNDMKTDREIARALYDATLKRSPSDAEAEPVVRYLGAATDRDKACRDVLWALVNTKEFMKVHDVDPDQALAISRAIVGAKAKK